MVDTSASFTNTDLPEELRPVITQRMFMQENLQENGIAERLYVFGKIWEREERIAQMEHRRGEERKNPHP